MLQIQNQLKYIYFIRLKNKSDKKSKSKKPLNTECGGTQCGYQPMYQAMQYAQVV
jgi:hypothetical protein